MKNDLKSQITYLFLVSYAVFLSSDSNKLTNMLKKKKNGYYAST